MDRTKLPTSMKMLHWIFVLTIFAFVTVSRGKTTRIIHGEDAEPGSLPYQVSLQWYFEPLDDWFLVCGGVVIGDRVALTAAHCISGAERYLHEYRIVVGDHLLYDYEGTEQFIGIRKIDVHPGYLPWFNFEGNIYPHDIAILFLDDDVIDKSAIIALATPEDHGDFAGTNCTISGWGLDTNGSIPNALQVVNMTVLSTEECTEYWGPLDAPIFDGQICVFNGVDAVDGAASCSGDSGGPMVCDGVLAGVTSWGLRGCRWEDTGEFEPSVYARVSYHQPWIQTTVERNWFGRL